MSDKPRALTKEQIHILKTLCEKYPESDTARLIATIEELQKKLDQYSVQAKESV